GNDTFGSGNVISGNRQHGVMLTDTGTGFNHLARNHIGTNYLSNSAVPNGQSGVRIENGATYNLIGGYTKNEGNIISGNGFFGVVIVGTGTAGNGVWGNHIGTDVGGMYAVGNGD